MGLFFNSAIVGIMVVCLVDVVMCDYDSANYILLLTALALNDSGW